jgi:RNA polymerase sigma factor (sigma-70 family)
MRLIAEPPELTALEERLDAVALRPVLAQALAALPEAHRAAVYLRVIHELSYPECAQRLGCSETTARQHVSRALRAMRTQIEGATP